MSALFLRILDAKRKRLLGKKRIFEPHRVVAESELAILEDRIGCALPNSLRSWLLEAGYGDLNEELSFREEWFSVVDRGQLKGHVFFAQDIPGNFYSFSPANGEVHYVCRSSVEYAFMAQDFHAFLEELERREFQLEKWIAGLCATAYEWGV